MSVAIVHDNVETICGHREAETVQQKPVYLRFIQWKKILYNARLIQLPSIQNTHLTMNFYLLLNEKLSYEFYLRLISLRYEHHTNCYRNNSFPRLYRQIYTNIYSFYSNQLAFHRSILKIRKENLSGSSGTWNAAAFVNWQLTLYGRAFSQLLFSSPNRSRISSNEWDAKLNIS